MTTQSPRTAADVRREHLHKYVAWITDACRAPGTRSALRAGLRRDLDHVRPMHRIVAPWLPRHRHVPETEERAYYLVASMIADRPRYTFATEDDTDDTAEEGESVPGPEAAGEQPQATDAPSGSVADDLGSVAADRDGQFEPAERWGRSLGYCLAQAVVEGPGREREMRISAAEARLHLLTRQSAAGLHRHLPATVRHLRQTGTDVDWAQLMEDLIAWPVSSGSISRRWLQDYYQKTDENRNKKNDQEDENDLLNDAP
ncbi:type I-E CRISPR-associated protein Cse2/CasB [Streptomyces cinereoruber]|uniref:type I-E CRISPR-associated protein Cse2/CasB n=1 Tax=Streptomyces cinereoruber TaxID=67260 RepID=UPI003631768F